MFVNDKSMVSLVAVWSPTPRPPRTDGKLERPFNPLRFVPKPKKAKA